MKQDIPDTLWIGFGRKDAPIVRDEARFIKYFHHWMQPHKFRVKNLEFWPGFSWGTIRLESSEARNTLLKHVIDKPFRPDNETGWVLNKFEKCLPVYPPENSPKKSPVKMVKPAKKRSSVADNLLYNNPGAKSKPSEKGKFLTTKISTLL